MVIDLDETSIDLEIPMWIPYLVIPISFAFGAYRVGEHIVHLIRIPAEDITFRSETQELMEEANMEQIVDDVNRKTGGML